MPGDHEVLKKIYNAFNAREIETVLAAMHPEVDWPNGWEGGRVHGHQGVRDYWMRQWKAIDPHVEPLAFRSETDGRVIVDVHQVVRDLAGAIVLDSMVQHVYLMEDGLVMSMEIR